MTEYIELTPTTRIAYEQDESPDDPRTWVPSVDCLVYSTSHRGNSDHLGDCQTDLGTVFTIVFGNTGDDALALKVAERYKRIFEIKEDIITYSARGYSQSDWWDVVAVSPEGYGYAEGHAKEFEMWARGDVMTIALERQARWARIDSNGEPVFLTEPHTMETWEEVDSLGGVYMDDDKDLLRSALDHFELDEDEKAIIKEKLA